MRIRFLSKGPSDQISGGYLYNKYLIEHLREDGLDVAYHADLSGIESVNPTETVIVDSIVLGESGARLLTLPAELILLLHVVPDLGRPRAKGESLLRALCRRSRVVVTGERTLASLRKIVTDATLDVVKIEPGVPEGWRSKRGYADKARSLLAVSNYIDGKGITWMLGYLAQLKHLPWTLTLHGNNELDPECFAAAKRTVEEHALADRVALLGPVAHRVINEKMLASDLLLHFSRSESYSMVTAEAIACGLPVLSYRTGNCDVFCRSGLVRYLERGDSSEVDVLGTLIGDARAYGRLRRVDGWSARTCRDVGREFLAMLEGS